MPTLIIQLGFSPVIVGTVYSVLPLVGMLVKPLFGLIADRFQRQKLLFLLFQVLFVSSKTGSHLMQNLSLLDPVGRSVLPDHVYPGDPTRIFR